MALTEEQTLIDVQIRNIGYHAKFDYQLRDMLSSAKPQLVEFKDEKAKVEAKEDSIYDEFEEQWEHHYEEEGGFIVNQPVDTSPSRHPDFPDDINGMTVVAVKQIHKDVFYSQRLSRWNELIDKLESNINLIESELDFRSQGIVERNPIGTTYYSSYDGNDSTGDATSSATPWRTITPYLENVRVKGDVLVMRRIRGGFNPGDNIWINNYVKDNDAGAIRNAKFNSSGTLTGGWEESITKHGTSGTDLVGQAMHRCTAGAIIPNTSGDSGVTSGTTKLPRKEYIDYADDGQTTGNLDGGWEQWYSRTTNPRDKSRVQMMYRSMYSSFYATAGDTTTASTLRPVSSGTHEDPIVVVADYENVWGDFLSTKDGQNGDDGLQKWSGSAWANDDAQYEVEVGSKVLSRSDGEGFPVEVHSFITPGDWICIGELESSGSPASFNSAVSDDPYEYSYMVRDVNYDKIVLWHPYKGNMAGSQKSVVSMGYAPRVGSLMKREQASGLIDANQESDSYSRTMSFRDGERRHWVWQGIEWLHSWNNVPWGSGGDYWNTEHLLYFSSGTTMQWKDCTFWGQSNKMDWNEDTSYQHCRRGLCKDSFFFTSSNHQHSWQKCLFSGGKYGIWDESTYGMNQYKIEDCIFNGSIMDITTNCMMDEWWSDSTSNTWYWHWATQTHGAEGAHAIRNYNAGNNYEIVDTEFVNWYASHITTHENTNVNMRGCKFLGMGMDFVDPTTTSNAEAQENLGLRYARACFAPVDNALADGLGDSTNIKYLNRATGDWENNGTDKAGANLGRQWFVYNPNDDDGTNAVTSNTAGSWYYQINDYNDSSAFLNGEDDNKKYMHIDMVDGTDTNSPYYNSVPMWNGAMALYGIKGLANGTGSFYSFDGTATTGGLVAKAFASDNSRVIFDWDDGHRGGDGGTWCLTANYTTAHGGVAGDSKRRFPHVYGGVPIPPSTTMASSGHTQFLTGWSNYWNGTSGNAWSNTDNVWGLNNHILKDINWHRQANNTSLALYDDAGTDWQYSRFEWDSSNGPGRGIGSMPTLGCINPMWDTTNPNASNMLDGYYGQWDMNNVPKITSQDHYELCLNNDYNHYVAWGATTQLSDQHWKIMAKPLNTGVNGIAKGIVYKQSSQNQSAIGERANTEFWKPYYWRPWLYETIVNTNLQQSGGGNYLIRAYPSANYAQITAPDPLFDASTRPDQLTSKISNGYAKTYQSKGGMKMFEYPFYLSTNARTYTVSVRRAEGSGEDWITTVGEEFTYSNYPGASDIYLEFEYWDMDHESTSMRKMTRKTSTSIAGVDFSTNAWQELSITIEPKTEGVGYLRLWYSKANEVGKLNTFYIDPKVVVY